ncbi:hypothetical protein CGCVW01_v011039 [Colletotrichum viniferum]|nr:hypothetical protein CGCVW01_v011039 [Colletotrichum viniferum]
MPDMMEMIEKGLTTQVNVEKAQEFVSRAVRLFALLVHIGRVDWFEFFRAQDFDDAMFPIALDICFNDTTKKERYTVRALRTETVEKIERRQKSVRIIKDGRHDRTCIKLLDSDQWRFFAPVFRPSVSVYSFHDLCILPFIRELEHSSTTTNLSVVKRYVIGQSHLGFKFDDQIGTVVDENRNPNIAVKELLTTNTLSKEDFENIVDNEEVVLKHLQNQNHDHFIKVIARYSQMDRHFFIFPWAEAGNLRSFWIKQPSLSSGFLSGGSYAPGGSETPEVRLDRQATVDPNVGDVSTRADAEEMVHELKKIVRAAEGKHQNSLSWINWDGTAHASGIGIPKIKYSLTTDRQGSQATQREGTRTEEASIQQISQVFHEK